MRRLLVILAVLAIVPAAAQASIINFGVDIGTAATPTYTQMGFFSGDNTGFSLSETSTPTYLEFLVNTPGLSSANITRFELFLDAEGITCNGQNCTGQKADEQFFVYLYNPLTNQGWAMDNSGVNTLVPNASAFGVHSVSLFQGDTDNSFFLTSPATAVLANDMKNGFIGVKIAWLGNPNNPNNGNGSARFDGVNLQVDYTAGQTSTVPEPASMLLLGTGLIGLAGAARRRLGKK